jgi:glycosyltransferase involved in cell wall biosynthesis
MNNKLKVVWICHFSNEEVRARLPLSKMKVHNTIRYILGKKKNDGYSDFAPWVTNLIKEFEKFNDVELHIISPFYGLKYFTSEFEMNRVFYHFYLPEIPIIHFNLPTALTWRGKPKFLLNRYFVKGFMSKIKPDIVNLIGSENPFYSITALDIGNIPVYVSTQTVYTNPDRKKYSDSCESINWDVELKIHEKVKYYGCSGRMHRDLILQNNPDAIIFKMFFPIEKPKQIKEMSKIFDFVFFASGLTKKKGIEDAIDALAIVKKEKYNVKLNIVGSCFAAYKSFLIDKINALDLKENIVFTEYFPIHSDLFQHISLSHFAVLPVKLDVIPSSIIEAILLGLPVVTYKTSGTPYLNKDGDSVLIADIGDIVMLAENMIKLINSTTLAKKLRENARAFVEREYDNTTSATSLIRNYKAVIEHFNNNTPIPENQLFNINEFPIY